MRLLLFCIFLFPLLCLSQKEGQSILPRSVQIDTNLQSGRPIKANQYYFQERIDTINVVDNNVILQLRGKRSTGLKHKGEVVNLNISSNKIQWTFDISYLYERIQLSGGHLIYYKANSNRYLDINSGERKWWVKNDFIIIDSSRNLGIGYKSETYPKTYNTLEAINLNNGSVVWSREVNRIEGWHNIKNINDTAVLISALGLYKVNLTNGKGWETLTSIGHKPQNNVAMGAVLGGAIGAFVVYTISTETRVDVDKSNLLFENDHIYYAYGNLFKMSMDGKNLWELKLKNKNLKNLELFTHNNSIVVVNKGYKMVKGKKVSSGKPLMAIVDTETGELQTNVQLGDVSYVYLSDYTIDNDTAFFILSNSILKYNLSDRKLLARKDLPHYNSYIFGELINNDYFILKDKAFLEVSTVWKDSINITTSNKKVIHFDRNLQHQSLSKNVLYKVQESFNDFKIMSSPARKFLVDLKNQPLLEVDSEAKIIREGKKLFITENNKLRILDLKDLL